MEAQQMSRVGEVLPAGVSVVLLITSPMLLQHPDEIITT